MYNRFLVIHIGIIRVRPFLAVPRPPFWIWILVFPKITKEFLYFLLLEKNKLLARKPLIVFFFGSKDIGKT